MVPLFVSAAQGGGDGQAGQRRQRFRAGSCHDRGAMVLDRALADAEIRGDVLAGMPGEHHVHDLALPRRQAGDDVARASPARRTACSNPCDCSSARSTLASSSLRLIGFSMKVRRARLHGLNRHRHVAVAGDHDGRQPIARRHGAAAAIRARSCRADRRRSAGMPRGPGDRLRGTPRRSHNPRRSGPRPRARSRIASRTSFVVVDDEDDGRLVDAPATAAGRGACASAAMAAADGR